MASVTLSWTASAGPNLAGYKIHAGFAPGGPYNAPFSPIDAGNVLTHTVSGLVYDTNYYFIVKAYNPQGAESGPSNEVLVNVATPAVPAPPTGLTVTGTAP